MGKKLHVGNLSSSATDAELLAIFGRFGIVESAKIIRDSRSGFNRTFGLVEMSSGEEAQIAINKLNFTQWDGRIVSVRVVRTEP